MIKVVFFIESKSVRDEGAVKAQNSCEIACSTFSNALYILICITTKAAIGINVLVRNTITGRFLTLIDNIKDKIIKDIWLQGTHTISAGNVIKFP